jgi:tyrosinase
MATRFVRQDIWKLEQQQPGHPITRAYASAIAVMKSRPSDDPTSLRYQAAVHGGSVTDKFLNQCQHVTWFFLSWHRLYLYWFEQILRTIIRGLDDVDDQTKETWALPYWNSWDPRRPDAPPDPNPFLDTLPLPFREPPDGTNPLFILQRRAAINGGGRIDRRITRPDLALREDRFSRDVVGAPPGFGGPPVGLHHPTTGGTPGALEGTPHNGVHGAVGGFPPFDPPGFMSNPNLAGRDPIFYLHHANIDRLWDVWLGQGGGRENPTSDDWLDEVFHFHDGNGNEVASTARHLGQLIDYDYADVSPPAGPLEAPPMEPRPEPDHPAELVGATDVPVELTGRTRAASFAISRPAGPLSEAGAEPSRVYLNVEDIRADENPGVSYAVYVNAPDQDDDPTDDTHYAGNITFFGIEVAQDLDRDHPGGHGGMRFAFDITDIYTRLRDAGLWDESQITVTFRPVSVLPPPGAGPSSAEPEEAPPVRIGRVSIFYQ